MKKLFALFVMAIFLISLVPAAFAIEDAGTDNTTAQANQMRAKKIKPMSVKARAEKLKEKHIEIRERYQKNKELMKERLNTAKERRKVAIQHHQEAKEKINARKAQLAGCKDNNSTECMDARKETRLQTKRYLTNVAEHILAMIAKTKERVENSNLADDDKRDLITKLDEEAEEIASALDMLEELGEDSTKEEFKEITQIIRESWKDLRLIIKKGVGKVANGKIHAINVRLGNLKRKLHKIVDRLENAGKDTSTVKPYLETFDEKLEEAKNHRDRARSLYQEGKIDEAAKATKEAHGALREAHTALKNFVRALKTIKGGEDALKGADTEESEETPAEQADDIDETPEEGNETMDDDDIEGDAEEEGDADSDEEAGDEASTEGNETKGNETA
ncbi:hypothetical protein KY338_00555 [Candidatus Woesearchaeota archaeon]|nr:hypothetical protein [Candidatus Woesearchaeota archaeon]MBW3005190.1 hypothetical protein [Candidatus Woesearchaeota archaeon]